ncbi:MAG: hypothetical protein QFF03_17630 [Pseudomonadota bacterium]|nr:hypothetical protein [Pseudomonadota bacterium]
MNTCIYDKTDKGREEIAIRKHQLAPRLRTLLVMLDGRHPLGTLLRDFAVLGLSEEHIDDLLRQQYIVLVGGGVTADAPAPELATPRPPASARARAQMRMRAQATREGETSGQPDQDDAPSAPQAAAPTGDDPTPANDAERYRELYAFYNQTIKSSIGLRGIVLQLKVEKAAGVDDLRALRLPFLQAVLKAKGNVVALSLRERLDHLLGGTPISDDFQLPSA